MKTVAIIAKVHDERSLGVAKELIEWLFEEGIAVTVNEHFFRHLGITHELLTAHEKSAADTADMVVVLGGDGTLIGSTRDIGDTIVPILGVNLGTLGFMTEITVEELYLTVLRCLRGNYNTTERMMLEVEVERDNKVIEHHHVLNDAVINKGALARTIGMQSHVDNKFLTNYKADGLIVSTPTGSTGYSMSAGGPIICPNHSCITITPICPHSLTNRPIILDASAVVRIELLSGDETVYLTLDGQIGVQLLVGDVIKIRQSDRITELIKSDTKDYFEILRTKLKWGEK